MEGVGGGGRRWEEYFARVHLWLKMFLCKNGPINGEAVPPSPCARRLSMPVGEPLLRSWYKHLSSLCSSR